METVKAVMTLVLVFVMFIVVLILAYLTTRYVGKKYIVRGQGSSMIKIVDRMAVSQDKQLLIVKIAGKYMLIGASAHGINKLCDIDETDLPPVSDQEAGPAFSQVLSKMLRDGFPLSNFGGGKRSEKHADNKQEEGPWRDEQ